MCGSLLASARVLPLSDCTTSTMCSALSSTHSWYLSSHRLRPAGPRACHSGWNRRNSLAFAATASDVSIGTAPTTRPFAGLRTVMASVSVFGWVTVIAGSCRRAERAA